MKLMNLLKRKLSRRLTICLIFAAFIVIYLSGLDLLVREKNFSEFSYPIYLDDFLFTETVKEFRLRSPTAKNPSYNHYSSVSFKSNIADIECRPDEEYYFLILVKSAPQNHAKRDAIRQTWKKSEPSTGIEGVSFKTLFFIGEPSQTDSSDLQKAIEYEKDEYQDIVQLDYIDNYYNNTIKTVMEMRYAAEHCSNFAYLFLVDDDYYVSLRNLYNYTQEMWDVEKLYAGFTFFSKPLRHRFWNKWFIDLDEYPFDYFPPYVNAGNVLLSRPALMDFYYATFFIKPFRFDDVFVGIVAKKLGIEPIHSDRFSFWGLKGEVPTKDLVAAHGYDPQRLETFWRVQTEAGFA